MKFQPVFFEFESYQFKPEQRRIFFHYRTGFHDQKTLRFTETIKLPRLPQLKNIPKNFLEQLLQSVHLMLGISYYKLYCPSKIVIHYPLTRHQAEFWTTVYTKGLGEFFYRNSIPSKGLIQFPYQNGYQLSSHDFSAKNRALLGIGGGKDSIVAGELLKEQKIDMTALLIETQRNSAIAKKVAKAMELPLLKIERFLDEKIFHHHEGSYNGHVPISGVFAFLGYLAAVFYDYSYVVVSNEYSSNFGNIFHEGEMVNHQWSKSSEFEELFQDYCRRVLTSGIVYFSALRSFYEIRIVEMFSQYPKYFQLFSSCNRNFKVYKKRPASLWCGECPKCLFVFALLSAFLKKSELFTIFQKNLYDDRKLLPLWKDILGFGILKPFDCVGTFEETQAAFFLARKKFGRTLALQTFLSRIVTPQKIAEKVFSTNPAATLPSRFAFLGVKKLLLLGYGKEGKISHKYCQKHFPNIQISIADKNLDSHYLEKQQENDLAIKTPGIQKNLVHIPYTTATNIFFSQIHNQTIGITGTKGKSTTSSLVYHILKEAGKKVRLLGNIGNPMLEVLLKPVDPKEIFVIELSSYQLEDIAFSPNIAVVLNLFPEHMNYHGSVEKYYEAKKNIVRFQHTNDFFLYNGSDAKLRQWFKNCRAQGISFTKTSIAGFETSLIGEHNQSNIRASVTVARLLGIRELIIQKAVASFRPLPHRLEFIGEFKGIQFYDDAISTTPESTIMAIQALKKVETLFLGGEDRGYDFSELEKILRIHGVKNIVLFPDSGKRILKSRNGLKVLTTSSMQKAVTFAYQHTTAGKICLLSTASPSYSLWKNFEEKGAEFQQWVKKISLR